MNLPPLAQREGHQRPRLTDLPWAYRCPSARPESLLDSIPLPPEIPASYRKPSCFDKPSDLTLLLGGLFQLPQQSLQGPYAQGWLDLLPGAECRGLAYGPGPASLGPPGPPRPPCDIHLVLSASLTESTPIRGKRLVTHPATHALSRCPLSPSGSTGAVPRPASMRVHPATTLVPPGVSLVSASVSVSVAGGAECGRGDPSGHLSVEGRGALSPSGKYPTWQDPQSAGSPMLFSHL